MSLFKNIKTAFFISSPTSRKSDYPVKDAIRKVRYALFGHLPVLGRRRNYAETHKARLRREREGFFEKYSFEISLRGRKP